MTIGAVRVEKQESGITTMHCQLYFDRFFARHILRFFLPSMLLVSITFPIPSISLASQLISVGVGCLVIAVSPCKRPPASINLYLFRLGPWDNTQKCTRFSVMTTELSTMLHWQCMESSLPRVGNLTVRIEAQ